MAAAAAVGLLCIHATALMIAGAGPPSRQSVAKAPLPQAAPSPHSIQADEASFAEWVSSELSNAQGAERYPEVFHDAEIALLRWRRRYRETSPRLWKSLMRADKVIKELEESAPVIEAVRCVVAETELAEGERISIIDLCSGKGFLSMFLSEMLDPTRVERCFLVDKAWPPHNLEGPIHPHHISDAHIYGERVEEHAADGGDGTRSGAEEPVPTYFQSWPVPLHTSKQNLKNKATMRSLGRHLFGRCSGPVLVLGVHLCGTLSLRAVDLFNAHPQAKLLILKPCCLPGMVHANRDEIFEIGRHKFDAKQVCASGRFTAKGEWKGPPRHHLKPRFDRWAEHLCAGIELGEAHGSGDAAGAHAVTHAEQRDDQPVPQAAAGAKAVHFVEVQTKGGYQNTFVFAERGGSACSDAAAKALTSGLWTRVAEDEMRT